MEKIAVGLNVTKRFQEEVFKCEIQCLKGVGHVVNGELVCNEVDVDFPFCRFANRSRTLPYC
jgi:hypothetical protein